MKNLYNIIILKSIVIILLLGVIIYSKAPTKDIVSTKQIEPYKVVLTKVDGKVVKTFYYKQQ